MDDGTAAIRAIIARSFALLAAIEHAVDPDDHIQIATGMADWILGKDVHFGPDEETRQTADVLLERAKQKGGKK